MQRTEATREEVGLGKAKTVKGIMRMVNNGNSPRVVSML